MRTAAIFLVFPCALSACTTLPKPVATLAVSAAEIVRAVECDLASVFQQSGIDAGLLETSKAIVELDLVKTNDNTLKPGATFKATVAAAATTVETKPSGDMGDKEVQTVEVDFTTYFADIKPNTDLGGAIAARCPAPHSSLAADGLGLAEWLHDALAGASGKDTAVQLTRITFKEDFTVTRTIKGGLTFQTNIATLGLNESQLHRKQQNTILVIIKVEEPPPRVRRNLTPIPPEERTLLQTPPQRGTIIQLDPDQSVIIETQ